MSVSSLGSCRERSVFIARNRENLYKLIDAILNINEEDDGSGEYVMLVSGEEGYRLDVKWISNEDSIVFADESSVYDEFWKEEKDAED